MTQELLNLYSYVPKMDYITSGSTQPETSDEIDGCISAAVLSIIRGVTGNLLDQIIVKDMNQHCNGCAIDHPSQIQHSCLFDPEDYYLHFNAKRLLTKLFKPWLKYTLARALKLCGISSIPCLEKIQAVAEAVVCELRDEPDFKAALRNIKDKTLPVYNEQVSEDIIDYWNFHSSLESTDPPLVWVTSSHPSKPSPIND
nr:TPA_asm: acintoc5 [Astyanax tetra cavefish adintovirus]